MTVRVLTLGINNYRAPIPSLLCCERDARDLTGVFKESFGFDAQYLEERKTEDVVQRIENLGKRLKPGDTFVFYFSGHGKAHKDDHYLLLPGAQLEALESGAVIGIGVLSYRHLKFLTSGPDWKGVHRLFIIDACRAPLVQNKAGELPVCDAEYLLRLPRPAADAIAEPSDEGLTLLNSCALGACAVELPEKGQDASDTGHGLFTASLLDLLRKARSSARDLVIDKSFAGALGETMSELAKKSRLPETVLHQPVLVGEGVRLAVGNVVEEVDDDETEWAIAKAKGTIEALEAYVRRKPPGKYWQDALALISDRSGVDTKTASSEPENLAVDAEKPPHKTTAPTAGASRNPAARVPAVADAFGKEAEPIIDQASVSGNVSRATPSVGAQSSQVGTISPHALRGSLVGSLICWVITVAAGYVIFGYGGVAVGARDIAFHLLMIFGLMFIAYDAYTHGKRLWAAVQGACLVAVWYLGPYFVHTADSNLSIANWLFRTDVLVLLFVAVPCASAISASFGHRKKRTDP